MPFLARVEASGVLAPGAIESRGVADEAPGHLWRCKWECRLVWRSVDAYQRTSLTDGWKLLEQGPVSQFASAVCSGGVLSVIGSSDLDGHTFHPSAVNGYPR